MNNPNPPIKRIVIEIENLIVYTVDEDTGFLFMGPAPRYYARNTKYNLEVGPHDSIEAVLYQYCSVYKEYRSKLIKTEQIDNHIAEMAKIGDTKPRSNVIHMDFKGKRRIK